MTSEPVDLESIERQVVAGEYADGLMEIFLPGLFLLMAALWLARPSMIAVLAVWIVLAGPRLLTRVKARFSDPRTGYAEYPADPGAVRPWGVIAAIAGGIGLQVVAVAVTGDLADSAGWQRWASLPAGLLCGIGLWYAFSRSHLRRFGMYAIISAVVGFGFGGSGWFAGYGSVVAYMLAMAVMTGLTGLVVALRFARRHPPPDGG